MNKPRATSSDHTSGIDGQFDRVWDELRALRGEMRAEFGDQRTEMRQGFAEVRGDLAASQRQFSRVGWAVALGLFGQLCAGVVAVVLAL